MSSARDPQLTGALAMLGALAMAFACKGPDRTSARGDDPASGSAQLATSSHPGALPADPPPAQTVPPAPVVTPGQGVVVMDEPKIDLPKQESFTLLDAGKDDRAVLRYALATGTVAFTARTALSSRHLDRGVFTAATTLPAMRDGFAITTAERSGSLALRALAGESTATSPDADAYLATWRSLLQNRRMTVAIDDRGQFSTIAFDDDPTGARGALARDELIDHLLAAIVPLPAERIGTGASWRVVTILRLASAYAKQTATYTLLARGPEGFRLHAKLQRVAEEQRITDPSLPAGMTATLVAMFRALEGDIDVDPKHPMITGGSLTIESRLHVKLQAPGQTAEQASEQIFEAMGLVSFSQCLQATAPRPAGRPAFDDCPAGFSR